MKKINIFSLVMITSAFAVSLRNLPMMAQTEMKMLFFGLFAAIFFFIPVSLTAAELATGWPKMGGIAVWVREAFGKKWGFFASWLQWSYMIIGIIAMLYFIGGSLAYVIDGNLASNRTFLIAIELIVIWTFTLISLKGLKLSSKISTFGFLLGVLLPGVFIIILGVMYLLGPDPIWLNLSLTKKNLLPNFHQFSNIVLLIAFMRAFMGIEVSAVHANRVKNPQKGYPIAILLVVIISLSLNIFGSLSIAIVIPSNEMSLIAGVLEAFRIFLNKFNLSFLLPYLAILVALGQAGSVNTWIMGPVKSMLESAKKGELPSFFKKVNKNEIPTNLIILQAIVMSVVTTAFLFLPSINIAFWTSVAIAVMIYVTMYFLMLLSCLYLRYKQPGVKRSFKIPFKNVGIWVVSIIGMITMTLIFIIAVIPPQGIPIEYKLRHSTIVIVSIIFMFIIPLFIHAIMHSKTNKTL